MKQLGLSQFIKPNENSTLFITKDEKHKIEVCELPILSCQGKIIPLLNSNNNEIFDFKAVELFKIVHNQLSNTEQVDKGLSLDEFKELLTLENLEKTTFIKPLLKLQEELKREIVPPQEKDDVKFIFNSLDYKFAQKRINEFGINYFVRSKLLTMHEIHNIFHIYLNSLAGWGIKQGSIIHQEINKNIHEIINLIHQHYPDANINEQHFWDNYLKTNIALDYEMAVEQQNLISICLLNKLEVSSNQVEKGKLSQFIDKILGK